MFAYALLFMSFRCLKNLYVEIETPKIERYIQSQLQDKAVAVELACFENPEFYDTYVKATGEAASRAFRVLDNIADVIWMVFNVFAVGTLIVTIDPIFLLFAIVPLICTLLFGKRRNKLKYDKDMKNKEVNRQKDYVRRTFYLADFSKEMRLSEMYKVMFRRMHDSVSELKQIANEYVYKLMWFAYLFEMVYDVIVYSGSIILAAYKTLVKSNLPIGDCFVVINSITNISYSINYMGDTFVKLDENSRYIDNLRAFLDYEIKIPENPEGLIALKHELLEVHNMSFTYDGQNTPVLKNIDFHIEPGEKIAIVGHNGAGKTTLVKLLLRLYDSTEGEIYLNGENITGYRLSSYRNLIDTVFQDYRLFSESVANNVMLHGNLTEQDRDKVEESLKQSGIYDKVANLPNGIDTTVTKEFDKDGAVFSGGEAQKISIARIFAREPQIVILDEPSSALDPIAESEMYRNMFSACEGKAVIFISHRLSCATMADRIYLFENGVIAESGKHSELLAKNGKYAEMWYKQAERYTGEEARA